MQTYNIIFDSTSRISRESKSSISRRKSISNVQHTWIALNIYESTRLETRAKLLPGTNKKDITKKRPIKFQAKKDWNIQCLEVFDEKTDRSTEATFAQKNLQNPYPTARITSTHRRTTRSDVYTTRKRYIKSGEDAKKVRKEMGGTSGWEVERNKRVHGRSASRKKRQKASNLCWNPWKIVYKGQV